MKVIKDYLANASDDLREEDYSSWGMHLGDASSLAAVYCYLKDENFEKARKLTSNLDTAVRDDIPMEIWKYVGLCPLHDYVKNELEVIESECEKHENE